MIKSNVVIGFPPLRLPNKPCAYYLQGKHVCKKIHKQVKHHATQFLELVHSNVHGPFKIQTLGRAKYFVTFVDDYSHRIRFYMMKGKDENLARFKIFKNEVETHGQCILMLRSNNGGEYINVAFTDFCETHDI
jgi:hypothetical protein